MAERLIGDWNERQARRMPLLLAPTMGAALASRYWFRGPACRTIQAIDMREVDRPPRHGRNQPHPRAVVSFTPGEPIALAPRLNGALSNSPLLQRRVAC
jgi:hypothetical protein